MAELASQFGVHPNMIAKWKESLKSHAGEAFWNGPDVQSHEAREAALSEEVGRLKFELDWLKKSQFKLAC